MQGNGAMPLTLANVPASYNLVAVGAPSGHAAVTSTGLLPVRDRRCHCQRVWAVARRYLRRVGRDPVPRSAA
jgi:hypothetical protein